MTLITGTLSGITEISEKTLLFLVLSGIATGASWLCYFKALQIGDVNKVVPIDKSSTILTILLACIFFHEGLSLFKLVCVCLIGLGTMLMINRKEDVESNTLDKSWLMYAILSAVFASLTSILGKIGISGIDSNLGTAIRTSIVFVVPIDKLSILVTIGFSRVVFHEKLSRKALLGLILITVGTVTMTMI